MSLTSVSEFSFHVILVLTSCGEIPDAKRQERLLGDVSVGKEAFPHANSSALRLSQN